MKVELKTWAGLGLATALAGAGLAGCSGEAGEAGEGGEAAATAQAGEGGEVGEGEGGEGEGGASGEGGVAVSEAGSDPVIYGAAIAVAEAHVIAARDAMLSGNSEAAAEMFAHPVSEVLFEMEPVFAERGVEDFKDLFTNASNAVLNGATPDEIDAKSDEIIATLRAAEQNAPDSGASAASIAAGVSADQIERAVAMYDQAVTSVEYGPYLDGYGYYLAAQGAFDRSADAILAEDADLHARLTSALDLLATAYPTVGRPEALDVDQGALQGASSSVMLAVN